MAGILDREGEVGIFFSYWVILFTYQVSHAGRVVVVVVMYRSGVFGVLFGVCLFKW